MKHFIYFDDRLLASYYAQAFGGLTTQRQQVVGDSTSSTTSDGSTCFGSNIEGEANALLMKATAKLNANIISPSSSFTENQLAQELVTSTMHDNMFDKVIEHATANAKTGDDHPAINDFISILIPLQVANLDEITKKFSTETFQRALKTNFTTNAFSESDPVNPNMSDEKWQKQRRDIATKQANTKSDEFNKNIELIRGMLDFSPVSLFLYGEFEDKQFIIPIKESYLREPLDYITTYMAGDVHVFGRVSKIGLDSSYNGALGALHAPIEAFTRKTIVSLCGIPVDQGTVILFPMAIYFQ